MENDNIKELIEEYLNQLDNYEKEALEIAKKNLKSSFDIKKSLGFLTWKSEKYSKNNLNSNDN